MSNFNMTEYPLDNLESWDNKINKKNFKCILQIASPKVHLVQIHLHIVLFFLWGKINLNQLYQTRR
jgi:hypothetical protein